jgi:asparagine synthase (glutamine-hydrolysing)
MPVLAGWLTGEQVPREIIEQTVATMGEALKRNGGEPTLTIQSGAGLIAFADTAYAMQHNDEPPVLDWVSDRRTLVYRRPLSGYHPFYYIENWPAQGNLLFASEIKALFAVGVPRKLHSAALQTLAQYGFVPAPWTIFQNVFIVPAGSILRWQHTKTVLNHSTDYRFQSDEKSDASATIEQLYTQLDKASADLLPPHEQLVAFTDGASTSTLATLLGAQHTSVPFTIASIDYTASETEETWREVEEIAQINENPLLTVQGVDQPEFWIATITGIESPSMTTRPLTLHQLLHTTAIETGARVALTGLGANALFGYAPDIQDSAVKIPEATVFNVYKQKIQQLVSKELLTSLWSADFAQNLHKIEPWEETLHARKLARRASQFTDTNLAHYYLDLHLRLPEQLVMPMQQLATQESMAVRSPYLHHRSIELVTQLPSTLDGGLRKDMLAEHFLRHYLQYQAPLLPATKQTSITSSLRAIEESELLHTLLSPEALQERGIFDSQAVAMLLQQPETRETNNALMLIFTTQLLCQLFQVEGFS